MIGPIRLEAVAKHIQCYCRCKNLYPSAKRLPALSSYLIIIVDEPLFFFSPATTLLSIVHTDFILLLTVVQLYRTKKYL